MPKEQVNYDDQLRPERKATPQHEEPVKRTISIAAADCAPSVDTLAELAQAAQENLGCEVETKWTSKGCTNSLRLTALFGEEFDETQWKLIEVEGKQTNVVWSKQTNELETVCEIIKTLDKAFSRSHGQRAQQDQAPVEDKSDEIDFGNDEGDEFDEEPDEHKSDLDFLGESASGVQAFAEQLLVPGSGLTSYSALLKALEIEFYRYDAYNTPLSLIIFEVWQPGAKAIPGQAVTTMALRAGLVKRATDLIGHFEDDFAIVMPCTQRPTASLIANKLVQILTAGPLAPGMDKTTLKLAFGIASLPDDSYDLKGLIEAAKNAKKRARDRAISA